MDNVRQTALITGCSDGGLGAALALELHSAGYRVFATARDVAKMKALPKDIERSALDVTSRESIDACSKEVSRRTDGTLNVLVNNAGVCILIGPTAKG